MPIHTTAPLHDRPAFKALEEHCAEVRKLHLRRFGFGGHEEKATAQKGAA